MSSDASRTPFDPDPAAVARRLAGTWDGPLGWVCPVCCHVWAPMESECVRCAVRIDPPPPLAASGLTPGADDGSFDFRATGEWADVDGGLQCRLRQYMFKGLDIAERLPDGAVLEFRRAS